MKKSRILGLVLVVLVSASQAHAGFYFDETFWFKNQSVNTGSTTTPNIAPTKGFGYDSYTTLGVSFAALVIGGTFGYAYNPSKSEGATGSAEINEKTVEYGPTLGVAASGFHAAISYFFKSTYTLSSRVTDSSGVASLDREEKDTGKGIYASVGYAFSLGPAVSIGPTLIWRNITFDKHTQTDKLDAASSYNQPETDYVTKASDSKITPMITLMIKI